MKTLKYGLAVVLMGSAGHAFAQYSTDALRFSQTQPVGTARSLGIGGATAAVGGDLGAVIVNPAGLGMFQRSEFSLSPGFSSIKTDSRAFGNTTADARNNLHLGSIGLVFVNRRPDTDGNTWRSGAFSIGVTRTADYNLNFRYQGQPDIEQDILQRLNQDQRGALDDLAYDTYLTDSLDANGDTRGPLVQRGLSGPVINTGNVNQAETVRMTGNQTQIDFAYGASYMDKLFLGGGIGIVTSRYTSENILTAADPTPVSNAPGTSFGSLRQRDLLETKGAGINARVGLMYKPLEALRIGVSVQTPTYQQFNETYNSSLQVEFDKPVRVGQQTYSSTSSSAEPNLFDYAVTSPFRATGGVAAVIGKYGFLSGDIEYVNYASARLSNYNNNGLQGNFDFGRDNDAVRRLYTDVVNLRLGGELRADIFRVRAGFAHYGSPYKSASIDQSRTFYTGGIGVRQKTFFLDAAGVYSTGKRVYSPYTLTNAADNPVVEVDNKRFTTNLTAGFMF
jgi:long-subunit fatty acid transport protein